jgi:hypothetical protein
MKKEESSILVENVIGKRPKNLSPPRPRINNSKKWIINIYLKEKLDGRSKNTKREESFHP